MEINILPSHVFNKIAAGEVVERPASVVKELVENSIDAGATSVRIEVKNGGIELIKITDNGKGIHPEDMPTAFAPHATSKIKTEEDLASIATLGFRGEALASISSVSKIKMTSATKDSEFASCIVLEGGKILSVSEAGEPQGTTIEVSDLFFNVPARKKFLKSQRSEEDAISSVVERFILSNPNISFKYILNDKEVFNFNASDLANAIFTVYGKNTASKVLPVNAIMGDMTIKGYIGKPEISKSNKSEQTLIINGRVANNSSFSAAVGKVYEAYLMKGKYPFFVLNLCMPYDKLDVNVHPSKMEVKFENNSEIFSFVYRAVNEAILNASKVNTEDALSNESIIATPTKSTPMPKQELKEKTSSLLSEIEALKSKKIEPKGEQTSLFNDTIRVATPSLIDEAKMRMANLMQSTSEDTSTRNDNSSYEDKPADTNSFTLQDSSLTNLLPSSYEISGYLFNTFIILESGDKCYFIDEHAAHERIMYDRLCKQYEKGELQTQPLLVPYTFSPNYKENENLEANIEALRDLGFVIEEYGRLTYMISEVPLALTNINLKEFISYVLSGETSLKTLKSKDIVKEKLMQHACKSAIKGGDKLSKEDINLLIKELISTNAVLQCPHGRPIVVSYTRKELDKWFKRIL